MMPKKHMTKKDMMQKQVTILSDMITRRMRRMKMDKDTHLSA